MIRVGRLLSCSKRVVSGQFNGGDPAWPGELMWLAINNVAVTVIPSQIDQAIIVGNEDLSEDWFNVFALLASETRDAARAAFPRDWSANHIRWLFRFGASFILSTLP